MGGALLSGLSQGIAQGQQQAVKDQYQKALIDHSKLQTKLLEQQMDLHTKAADYVKLHPELAPVLMGLQKPTDPLDQAVMGILSGGMSPPPGVPQIPSSGPGSGILSNEQADRGAFNRQYQQSRATTGASPPLVPLSSSMAELMPTIGEVAGTNQLPVGLLANLINTESGGRNVQNAQGTPYWGPGQVGVGAAQEVWGPDAKHPSEMTPQENVATSGAYLRRLLDKNNQDVPTALKQYGGFVTKDPSGYIQKVVGGLPDQIAQGQLQNQLPQGPPITAQPSAPGFQIDRNKLLQGILNKKYGYPEDEVQWLKGVDGTNFGVQGPVSLGVDKKTGKPLPGLVAPEAVAPVAVDVTLPNAGGTEKRFVNPYQQAGGPTIGGAPAIGGGTEQPAPMATPGGIMTKPPKNELTDSSVDTAARTYIRTGTLPSMGMGANAGEAKSRIMNRADELIRTGGITPEEMNMNQAEFKAAQAELTRLQTTRGQILSFAKTADENLKLVEELSAQTDRTGIPVVNKWLNAGKRSVAGDPTLAKYDAALRTAINEYAKVTSSATGGGVTSDSARKEVESLLNDSMTVPQVKAVVALLRQEMQNRVIGFDDQVSAIRETVIGKNKGTASTGGIKTAEDYLKAKGLQ